MVFNSTPTQYVLFLKLESAVLVSFFLFFFRLIIDFLT